MNVINISFSLCLHERQRVCLQVPVAALVEPLLLGGPGLWVVDAPPGCLRLSSPQPLSLRHLLSPGHLQHVPGCSAGWCGCHRRCDCREGHPSLAAPSMWPLSPSACRPEWLPMMCWELKHASSQTACVVSWLVHSLAPLGDS